MFEKLIKKYGKKKLAKFLLEIHPHLNTRQKKMNTFYIKSMNFGALTEFDKLRQNHPSLSDILLEIPQTDAGRTAQDFNYRSELIIWKDKILDPKLVIKYKSSTENHWRDMSNLIALLLTVLLAEYTNDADIQKMKKNTFDKYFSGKYFHSVDVASKDSSFETKPPGSRGDGWRKYHDKIYEKTQYGADRTEEIVKAELLILLMRIIDMVHDFFSDRWNGSFTNDQKKQDNYKKIREDGLRECSTILSSFLQKVTEIYKDKDSEKRSMIVIVFYSFKYTRWMRIKFFGGEDREEFTFPTLFRNVIEGLQGGGDGERTPRLWGENLDITFYQHLEHFNRITVGDDDFRLRNLVNFELSKKGSHAIIKDLDNDYSKIAEAKQNLYLAPSTFTDPNSHGPTQIIIDNLLQVKSLGGETIYFSGKAEKDEAYLSAVNKKTVDPVRNVVNYSGHEVIPRYITDSSFDAVQQYNSRSGDGKESIISCYNDVEFQFLKPEDSVPYSRLKFKDYFERIHIILVLGAEHLHSKEAYNNEKTNILSSENWTPIFEYAPVELKDTEKPPPGPETNEKLEEFARNTKITDYNVPLLEGRSPEDRIYDGYPNKFSDTGIHRTKRRNQKHSAKEQPHLNAGSIKQTEIKKSLVAWQSDWKNKSSDAGITQTELVDHGIVFAKNSEGYPTILIIHRELGGMTVKFLASCMKIANKVRIDNVATYVAQLTTIKFFGDSSQSQTPLRHLFPDKAGRDRDKSVLLIQGDSTSVIMSAFQNKLVPLVRDNYKKCNVLGGHPSNSGKAGLFTLPALDIVPLPDPPPRVKRVLPPPPPPPPPPPSNQLLKGEIASPDRITPVSMTDSPERPELPSGWNIDTVGDYFYEKIAYTEPDVAKGWEYITSRKGPPYWRYYAVVGKDYKHDIPETVPPEVIAHKDLQTTPPRGVGEVNSDPRPVTGETPDSKKLKFGAITKKNNWETTPVTLTRMFVNIQGEIKYVFGIRESELFEQLGITNNEIDKQKIRNIIKKKHQDRHSSPGPIKTTTQANKKTFGTKSETTGKESETRLAKSVFGKRQWYVDRTRNNKLCRKQCKGSNPSWVTPQYYKKITGKSFWKLPVAKK